jgi:hypothetical protein
MSNSINGTIHSSITIRRCALGKAVAIRRRDTNPTVLVVSIVSVPSTGLSAETILGNITKTLKYHIIFKAKNALIFLKIRVKICSLHYLEDRTR